MEGDSETNAGETSSSNADETKPKNPGEAVSTEDFAKASSSAASDEGGAFECNICFEPAKDSVVTMCGHLFWYVKVAIKNSYSLKIFFVVEIFVKINSSAI